MLLPHNALRYDIVKYANHWSSVDRYARVRTLSLSPDYEESTHFVRALAAVKTPPGVTLYQIAGCSCFRSYWSRFSLQPIWCTMLFTW